MKADLTVSAGSFTVAAQLSGRPGEVVALVGPNGAGKSTLLAGLAGLAPAHGSIEVDGQELVVVPPERRGIGWVPQAGLLFPHLSALDNAAYGLRAGGVRRAEARRQASSWLERLGVAELADRRPAQLSGGQAQRVALARALVGDPALVLLDEPLGALDAGTRDDVRRTLRTVLTASRATSIVVTHDPVDAVALADRMVVLEAGAVLQDGSVAEVTAAPRSPWVAELLGQNAWRGTSTSHGMAVDGGGQVECAEPLAPGWPALALAWPGSITLHRSAPTGSARNLFTGAVVEATALGSRVRVRVASRPAVTAEVTAASAADLRLADGGPVWATLKATEVRLVAL